MSIEDRRRYRLRHIQPRAPSSRALWARVALYTVLLVVILVMQSGIGRSAAGCVDIFK